MRGKCIGRDPAGAFGKERNAVDGKLEGLPPFIRFALEMQCAQADALRDIVQKCTLFAHQVNRHHIQRLFAHAVRPPQFRLWDVQGDVSQTFFEGDIAFNHRILSE